MVSLGPKVGDAPKILVGSEVARQIGRALIPPWVVQRLVVSRGAVHGGFLSLLSCENLRRIEKKGEREREKRSQEVKKSMTRLGGGRACFRARKATQI